MPKSERPWKGGHELNQIADAKGQLIGSFRDRFDAELAIAAVNAVSVASGAIRIDAASPPDLQRAALLFAAEILRSGPRTGRLWPAATYDDAIAALERWSEPYPTDVPSTKRDLEARLAELRAASRPKEPLTTNDGPTAQGHIVSAISKLERERELLYRKG